MTEEIARSIDLGPQIDARGEGDPQPPGRKLANAVGRFEDRWFQGRGKRIELAASSSAGAEQHLGMVLGRQMRGDGDESREMYPTLLQQLERRRKLTRGVPPPTA